MGSQFDHDEYQKGVSWKVFSLADYKGKPELSY